MMINTKHFIIGLIVYLMISPISMAPIEDRKDTDVSVSGNQQLSLWLSYIGLLSPVNWCIKIGSEIAKNIALVKVQSVNHKIYQFPSIIYHYFPIRY